MLAYWADDAVVFPPEGRLLEGKVAIREYVAGALSLADFSIRSNTNDGVIAAAGDMGYLAEETFPDGSGGAMSARGKSATI